MLKFGSPEYSAWENMKTRCYNPNSPGYKKHGAIGIKVCDEWKHSFESFYESVGIKPSRNYRLGRIDPKLGYEPGNVRWVEKWGHRMLKDVQRAIYRPRNERPAPHPVFVPRPAVCLECGGEYRQTAAAMNACPGECRDQRAARLERRSNERRVRRMRAARLVA